MLNLLLLMELEDVGQKDDFVADTQYLILFWYPIIPSLPTLKIGKIHASFLDTPIPLYTSFFHMALNLCIENTKTIFADHIPVQISILVGVDRLL